MPVWPWKKKKRKKEKKKKKKRLHTHTKETVRTNNKWIQTGCSTQNKHAKISCISNKPTMNTLKKIMKTILLVIASKIMKYLGINLT